MDKFLFAAMLGALLPLALGYPIAVLLGFDRGMRSLGFAAAIGMAVILIACRAVQMVVPIGSAAHGMLAVAVLALGAWCFATVRRAAIQLVREERYALAIVGLIGIGLTVLINTPIIFGNAIQFDGTRNADSFTFTSNAQYMLGHVFHDAPDFSPEHPVYAISGSYFGAYATQPRPAAEGFLAWISALYGADPMYFYNALQTAGILLAGLAVFAFLPATRARPGRAALVIVAVLALGSPGLLNVVLNSNFANGMSLAAATAYVALALIPRRRWTFITSTLLLGSLLSGYPELLIFVGACRGIAVLVTACAARAVRPALIELTWLLAELMTACALLPWSAWGSWMVYKTSMSISHGGATGQVGNMYAGLPLAIAAAMALALAWKALGDDTAPRRARPVLLGILIAYAFAQIAMATRSYDYGGFKISQYFVTLLSATLATSLAALIAATETNALYLRLRKVALLIAVLLTAWIAVRDLGMVRRSWLFAAERKVTPDLVTMAQRLKQIAPGRPVAMGGSPAPFYYGMWVPYVTDAIMTYDFEQDPDAAGYLSPYLHTQHSRSFDRAGLVLSVGNSDLGTKSHATDAINFGAVHLFNAPTP